MEENVKLTEEMFEAVKIVMPALTRARGELAFTGYLGTKSVTIKAQFRGKKGMAITVKNLKDTMIRQKQVIPFEELQDFDFERVQRFIEDADKRAVRL